MTTVYLYIVGASPDPHEIRCSVPWRVDDDEIFFGPCKKPIRAELRRFLNETTDRTVVSDDVYLVGFNAVPHSGERIRNVVWVGKVGEAMSFARAWLDLTASRYDQMRSDEYSPLHLAPVCGDGRPTAYRHHGLEHKKGDEWLDDVLGPGWRSSPQRLLPVIERDEVRLSHGTSWWEGFPLDVCFLLENVFFASARRRIPGLSVDSELATLLRAAQRRRPGVNEFAVFGVNEKGDPYGRGHVKLTGPLSQKFLKWLDARLAGRVGTRAETLEAPVRRRRDSC
jgi:hypothetical protein